MSDEKKPKGRKPGNAKYTESLQMPCTVEMRDTVEEISTESGMTVPAIMRRAMEMYIENWQKAKDGLAELQRFKKRNGVD